MMYTLHHTISEISGKTYLAVTLIRVLSLYPVKPPYLGEHLNKHTAYVVGLSHSAFCSRRSQNESSLLYLILVHII